MKISYSPYVLRPLSTPNAVTALKEREGALLQIGWPDGRLGYADLHPWPELGDAPLDEQLTGLRNGKISAQAEQSIWLAHRDADLRQQKKSIFDSALKLKNNFVVTNCAEVDIEQLESLRSKGFTCLKIKVGRNLQVESEFINQAAARDFLLRLDFNGVGRWQIFERFMSRLEQMAFSRIEYVEDPFPFDDGAWAEARQLVPIALDNQFSRVVWKTFKRKPFDVLVIKPAKIDVERAIELCKTYSLKATVTSYMDHPVGVMHALGVAMALKKNHGKMMLEPGCLTHLLYESDLFSKEIVFIGPSILKVPGTGVGFDALLEGLKWHPIKLT